MIAKILATAGICLLAPPLWAQLPAAGTERLFAPVSVDADETYELKLSAVFSERDRAVFMAIVDEAGQVRATFGTLLKDRIVPGRVSAGTSETLAISGPGRFRGVVRLGPFGGGLGEVGDDPLNSVGDDPLNSLVMSAQVEGPDGRAQVWTQTPSSIGRAPASLHIGQAGVQLRGFGEVAATTGETYRLSVTNLSQDRAHKVTLSALTGVAGPDILKSTTASIEPGETAHMDFFVEGDPIDIIGAIELADRRAAREIVTGMEVIRNDSRTGIWGVDGVAIWGTDGVAVPTRRK